MAVQVVEDMQEQEKSREQLAEEVKLLQAKVAELERFRKMADLANYGCAMVDAAGNILYVNESFAGMHGYSIDELMGKNLAIFHTPQQMDHVAAVNRRLAETGHGLRGEEIWHVRRDGTEFPTLMSTWRLLDEHGNCAFLCATAIDITAHRGAEESLSRERNLLRALIDSLPDRIYVKDRECRFVICNKAVAQDAQFPAPDALIGKSDFDLFPREKAQEYFDEEQRIMRTGQPMINVEKPGVTNTGDPGYALNTKVPWRDSTGNIIGIVGANRDITEHRRAEDALSQSEGKFRTLVSNIPGAAYRCACDKNWTMEYISDEIERITSYPASDFLGNRVRSYASVIHPDDRKMVEDVVLSGVRENQAYTIEYRVVDANGEIHWVYERGRGVLDEAGHVVCLDGGIFDITSRKEAAQALQESEERYRLLVEQLPAVTYTAALDEASTTLYVSPQVEQILGISPDAYKADPDTWRERLHPDDRDRVMAEVEQAHKTGKPFAAEYRMIATDGHTVWVRDEARILRDESGRPFCLQGVMYDITRPKEAEEALRQSEEKFRGLAERSFDVIYITDLKGNITYISPACQRVFGYDVNEMLKRHFTDFLLPEEKTKAVTMFMQRVSGGEHGIIQLRAMRKSGSEAFIELNSSLVLRDGRAIGVQGIIRDVTERVRTQQALKKAKDELELRVQQRTADLAKVVDDLQGEVVDRRQAEEALRKAEERFRTIFENTVVGLYRTTPDGRILMANPAIVRMLGYSSFEELARINLEQHGLDASTPRAAFKELMERHGRVIGLESIWIRRDGSRLFVCESAVAVRNEKSSILYYEGTAEDITERKKVEQKLLAYQRRLRSLAAELSLAEERLRRRIATDVHDNISQNLAISKIKLESVAEAVTRKDLHESLEEVLEILGQTIESTRTLTFEMSPPVLYELGFEAAVGWLARQTRQRFGLEVEFHDDGRAKPLHDDVRVLLFQAVRELLVNVVKHAEAGRVVISAKRQRREIAVTVEDDGKGFDVAEAGAGDYKRGGYGLFSIRERLDQIGGKVEIESRPGSGTRATLVAPVHRKSKGRKGAKK